jgi:NAD(P)H-flavin reductase
MIGKPLKR